MEELERAQQVYDLVVNYLVTYSFQIVAAIIIMLLGNLVAKKISSFLENLMVSKGLDVTLSRFAASFVKVLILTFAAITALDMLDISITPFVAAVGALSLGAGLALQGLLSNYGAGISIIVARPFVVGDTIKVQGVTGIVKEVKLAYTILTNEDEVEITIPNKHIVGEIIHNSQSNSIIESSVGIAYDSDTDLAIATITQAVVATAGVATDRAPQIGIDNFGDSSIDIGIRYWVPTDALFDTKFRVNKAVFQALGDNGIEIPFPQRFVHLVGSDDAGRTG